MIKLKTLLEGAEFKKIKPNKFVYHVSNPHYREKIEKEGLKVGGKKATWLDNTKIEGKVIFATNSDNKKDWFDSTYDDDIYKIDTSKSKNTWYEDPNFDWKKDNKHIFTFENVPQKAIKLIYTGSGN